MLGPHSKLKSQTEPGVGVLVNKEGGWTRRENSPGGVLKQLVFISFGIRLVLGCVVTSIKRSLCVTFPHLTSYVIDQSCQREWSTSGVRVSLQRQAPRKGHRRSKVHEQQVAGHVGCEVPVDLN